MRPIARQSARLASHTRVPSSSRARQPSVPRAPQCQQARAFNSSVKRASESRPPPGTPDHRQQDEEHRKRETEAGITAKAQSHQDVGNGETKPSSGGRKSRGPLRQQRVADVPKPPPIPDWFLKHNVTLVAEDDAAAKAEGTGQVMRCVDTETGHTLFTVPYYGEGLLPSSKKQKGLAAKNHPFFSRSFTEPQAAAEPKDGTSTGAAETKEASSTAAEPKNKRAPALDPMARVFLEIEATARASLALPDELHTSSFASSRVDMSLVCPDPNSHDQMDELVQDLARIVRADVVRIDTNDIEELTSDYVGAGRDSPGTFSTLGYDVFDGYEATNLAGAPARHPGAKQEDEEFDEDEDDAEEDEDEADRSPREFAVHVGDLRKALSDRKGPFAQIMQRFGIAGVSIGTDDPQSNSPGRPREMRAVGSSSEYVTWDDARLVALLEGVLDASKQKRSSNFSQANPEARLSTVTRLSSFVKEASESLGSELPKIKEADKLRNTGYQRTLRDRRSQSEVWNANVSQALVALNSYNPKKSETSLKLEVSASDGTTAQSSFASGRRRTIVQVRDLKDICRSRLGDEIVRRLVHVVQKRRAAGESVLIVGTSASAGYGTFATDFGPQKETPFRTIEVPPFFMNSVEEDHEFSESLPRLPHKTLKEAAYNRIMEINLRHIQSMLRRLRPSQDFDLLGTDSQRQMSLPGTYLLTEKVLSLDHVQRLALTAFGLSLSHAKSEPVRPVHVALATLVTAQSDNVARHWKFRARGGHILDAAMSSKSGDRAGHSTGQSKVDAIKASCNPHESKLLASVVDSQNIKTGFNEVHAPPETIEALKTLTSLSLARPDAFKYGVLANDRLPGLMLYGPPGTGKTLLAKAVAKESNSTVLEISGAQIYEKYVGEGEKMVRAVFSLAKKLSPCIVFIDEADAIFGSRSNAGNRNTHREIINQFLREWDGMDDHGVFMMVASNRPFDLDDAVLRRLPRRLLVDLPVAKDRESILGIHLKHEVLASSVSLPQLAEQTPLYSGSDLKNLCVSAALACVREENALAEQHKDDSDFKLPEKRTLTAKHFDTAIAEISASISEDMSSLTAIRKFDEQYGDRRGRRKKSGYGFGIGGDGSVDESSARVRSTQPPPP